LRATRQQANCQVAVTLSIANHHASLPIAYRLYLRLGRRCRAPRQGACSRGDPLPKPQIALAQIRAALAAGVAPGVVLIDASYGTNTAFRTGIRALGLTYVAAILSTVKVRAAANPHDRVSVLALGLPNQAWRTITWREGSGAPLRSRFARVRVRIAPSSGAAGRAEEPAPGKRVGAGPFQAADRHYNVR
jgi:SRSO17 transposase